MRCDRPSPNPYASDLPSSRILQYKPCFRTSTKVMQHDAVRSVPFSAGATPQAAVFRPEHIYIYIAIATRDKGVCWVVDHERDRRYGTFDIKTLDAGQRHRAVVESTVPLSKRAKSVMVQNLHTVLCMLTSSHLISCLGVIVREPKQTTISSTSGISRIAIAGIQQLVLDG